MSFSVMLQQLAGGMLVSVEIFFITLLFSLPLGLLICFGRMSRNKVIRTIVSGYISIMRGTPLMLQLMVVYFGPYYLFRIKVGSSYRLWATFIGFVINYAAYFAEIYRSGIQSMPVGQYEAAEILGYGKAQTFFKIILSPVSTRIPPSVTHGLYVERGGDVLNRQGAGGIPDEYDAVCGSSRLLLYFQSGCGSCNGMD